MILHFDSHCHTRFSDGTIFYNGIADLKLLAKKHGINAFTMTDHNTTRGQQYGRRACERLGLPFIPALEVSTKNGHLVAYGVEEWNHGAYSLGLFEALDLLESLNAVVVVAHPFDRMGIKDKLLEPSVQKLVHGYEFMNGASPGSNLRCRNVDQGLLKGLCRYSGSDCHSKVLYHAYHVEVDVASTRPDDILEAMRRQDKVQPRGFFFNIPLWIKDFPPAETGRRKLKAMAREKEDVGSPSGN